MYISMNTSKLVKIFVRTLITVRIVIALLMVYLKTAPSQQCYDKDIKACLGKWGLCEAKNNKLPKGDKYSGTDPTGKAYIPRCRSSVF